MSKKQIIRPTDSELEILQVLWENGPQSVRFVNELLNEEREVGYTTTLKIMQIMFEKGLVDRDDSSRTHIYRAKVKEEEIQKDLLDKFVDTAFRGSAAQLVMSALGNGKASREELDEIKMLIEKLENKKS
ncbi:MAG: BlaI/MecI/CopY family transcriptional regulator [Saprospiraceae bacterium]|nr:BlaI/MecI/CopY family transcriptional regulator [Saprospiraceae bacterium]